MKKPRNLVKLVVIGILAFAVAGCASARDRKTDNTLIGAGLGAAAGAVISEGDPLYTIGGAAAGGLLGNILTEDRRSHRRNWDRGHRRHYSSPPHRHVQKRHHHKGRKHHHHHHRR